MANCSSTIYKKEKQSTATITVHCWTGERRNHKETASFVEEKMHLFSRQCTSSQIDKNDGYFEGLEKSYYKKGIEMLNDRWTKYVSS